MNMLPVFLELQSVHDNLSTIQRDLTAFPPEIAKLDTELKAISKSLEAMEKTLADANASLGTLTMDLQQAEKHEGIAKSAVKNANQKVQFTAAIRELDERERQKAAVVRPLKEAEARRASSEAQVAKLKARREDLKTQFDTLHEIFLSEHENQVVARERLLARKKELEIQLEQGELVKFNRLLQARHGKAVVSVENGTCTGCRTKIRTPLLYELREKSILLCENCQRILYSPTHP